MTQIKNNNKEKDYFHIPSPPFSLKFGEGANHRIQLILSDNEHDKTTIASDFPYFKASLLELVQAPAIWYVGCGSLEKLDETHLADIFKTIAKKAVIHLTEVQVEVPIEILQKFSGSLVATLLSTAFAVESYPVDFLKSKPQSQKIMIEKVFVHVKSDNSPEQKSSIESFTFALEQNHKIAEHINGMRQVQALPGNYANPESLEKKFRDLAQHYNLKIKVYQKEELEKIGAGGILTVGKGSAIAPRMITLEYNSDQEDLPSLSLVGKGVTFDTGGISLKPGADMHEMKFDLSGAASVVHALCAIATLNIPVKASATIGLVENMPSSTACKPGDVYTALNGTTVEVQNTDAEGRLVLGDLLTHAQAQFRPDLMIDLATLTGAIVVALGPYYAGLFTPSSKAKATIEKASQKSGEPVWQMPMGRLYKDLLKSEIADYNNIGGRQGGSSSAASFLSVFVKEETAWAHIDIAGVAYTKKGVGVYPPVAGFGIRLLVDVAKELAEKGS